MTIKHEVSLEYINIEFDDKIQDHLYQGIIGYCCKNYSNNQLKQIWKGCVFQISSLNSDDVPPVFYDMLKELFIEIKNRRITIEDELLESGLPIWFKR